MKAADLPTNDFVDGFYPTPPELAKKMLADIEWHLVTSILEPSAGKGDLVKHIQETHKEECRRYSHDYIEVDCVEIDPILHASLIGQGLRVVHDDFMTFHTHARYDLIVMNPPFQNGCTHLLRALELVKPGGMVVCILNAETLRNPYTKERKQLAGELSRRNASIIYLKDQFVVAERKTGVEVALVRVEMPKAEHHSLLLEHLRKAHYDPRLDVEEQDIMALARKDLQAIIDLYNFEAEAGKRFLEDYQGIRHYFLDSTGQYASPIIDVKVKNASSWSVNGYLRLLRKKYWNALFEHPEFTKQLTSNVRSDLYSRVDKLQDYEFSWFNIKQLQLSLSQNVLDGIRDTILRQFDSWSKYALYDGSQNVHYFNGWKTNQAHKIGHKLILPFYQRVWNWSNQYDPANYRAIETLSDIEKVFDYLNGRTPSSDNIIATLKHAEMTGQNRKIPMRYYHVSFFKKGTIHIVFTDLDALDRFNRFAAQHKNWLPPTYGKTHYQDMSQEERDTVDTFEGEERYEDFLSRASAQQVAAGGLGLPVPNAEGVFVTTESQPVEQVVETVPEISPQTNIQFTLF